VGHENRPVDIVSLSVLISVDVLTAHGTILCSYYSKCRKYDIRFFNTYTSILYFSYPYL
jgi:hypothetical protein